MPNNFCCDTTHTTTLPPLLCPSTGMSKKLCHSSRRFQYSPSRHRRHIDSRKDSFIGCHWSCSPGFSCNYRLLLLSLWNNASSVTSEAPLEFGNCTRKLKVGGLRKGKNYLFFLSLLEARTVVAAENTPERTASGMWGLYTARMCKQQWMYSVPEPNSYSYSYSHRSQS